MKALDLLKSALTERQAKAQKTISETGQKWVRRGDVEAKRKEEYLEEQRLEQEKQQAEEEARLQKFDEQLAQRKSKIEILNKEGLDDPLLADALLDDDDAEPPLSLSEVVDRLRELGHPITIFGETDMQRYKRMRLLEKEIDEGRQNPDVLMLEQVNESQRLSLQDQQEKGDGDHDDDDDGDSKGGNDCGHAAADDKSDSEDEDEQAADDKSDSEDEGGGEAEKAGDDKSDSEDEGGAAAKVEVPANDGDVAMKDKPLNKEDLPEVEINTELMDKCDFVRVWTRKALKVWEKELADLPDEEKKTSKVKTQVAAHRQVRRDVRPLQKRLKLYVLEEWLLGKIHVIVKFAEDLEYRAASEAYLDLSIGKAAWPVGIGCGGSMLMEDAIGLHDRFNRMSNVKDIAFALNDDVTRKFVQALKRLMNVAQRHWPPIDPSKLG